MSGIGSVDPIDKFQFVNKTSGHFGVVILDPLGRPTGANVEPGCTVWLSEAEMKLTARASRLPADNPFLERTEYVRENEVLVERKVTPLTPVVGGEGTADGDRWVPPVGSAATLPDAVATAQAAAAATAPEPTHLTAARPDPVAQASEGILAEPEAQERATQAIPPPPAPAPGAQTPPTAGPAEQGQSWTERDPNAPLIVSGDLGGENLDEAPLVGAEETAAQATPAGEETGAAVPPQGAPSEGEFASHEEVGSPDAPAHQPTAVQP